MTPRDRRVLMLGGGVILAAVVLLRLGPWAVRAHAALRDRAVESTLAVARAHALLTSGPVIRDSLGPALAGVVALAPRLLDGATAAEAGATLAGQVSAAAAQSGLRVLRIDPLPDSAGLFGRVSVRAELEGDIRGLVRWLKAVERGDLLLTVPAFSVATNEEPAPSGAEALRIEASVAGYFLRREAR